MKLPLVIQAGMGIGISNWKLAKSVSMLGQMGVVSGTALDSTLVRRLQDGDKDHHLRRALSHFPFQEVSNRILKKYFIPDGKAKAYSYAPMLTANLTKEHQELLVAANFVEVFLAKEGHEGTVGINYLEKVQFPILPSLYGAILAGVDAVLMGAGIPKEIPRVIQELTLNQDVSYKINVSGSSSAENFYISFSPSQIGSQERKNVRPLFFAVISSNVLALALTKRAPVSVDGFIVETSEAGGHNAPPRGPLVLNSRGEPIYGSKDEVDLTALSKLGLPFWLAGGQATPMALKKALDKGAQGIQVGTAFALCEESGLDPRLKKSLIEKVMNHSLDVFTDPQASPTGFPFKVACLDDTLSDEKTYAKRKRKCDLGYLREAYKKPDGSLGYRCPAEPIDTYLAKGGSKENTIGRKCLCNGLMSNIGLAQKITENETEKPLITIGNDVYVMENFLKRGQTSYSAKDVLDFII